jgi:hypothetical protein
MSAMASPSQFGGRERQRFGVAQERQFTPVEHGFGASVFERHADLCGARVVVQQSPQPDVMVLDAVFAAVEMADVDARRLEQPAGENVAGVMQDALVERQVPLHRVRPQAVHAHDVVDAALRTANAVVEVAQAPGGVGVGDRLDPGRGGHGGLYVGL